MPAGEIATRTGRTAVTPAAAPQSHLTGVVAAPALTPMQQAAQAYEHSLQAKVAYAKFLAGSNLLPRSYQNQPANILFALEYGQALGISPIAAMMGIHVIEGRPSASSGLISALVRTAGHKLRVTGDGKSATCTIIRSDDPDYEFRSTFTWEDAVKASLTGKSVWKQYPGAMLRARAITACARDACQEVLYGLIYTPEELGRDILDGEAPAELTPPADSGPYAPQQAAVVTEEHPEGLASRERVEAVSEALRTLGMKDAAEQRDAVETIILPGRNGERVPEGATLALTVEECQFIMDELAGLQDLDELKTYLASPGDADGN